MLYKMAKIWIEASCPIDRVRSDFLRHLKETLDRGVGCSFLLGSELTRSGKPAMVYCFRGELFTFELTADQAQRLRLEPGLLVTSRGLNRHDHDSRPEPLVRLSRVEVANGEALDRQSPVKAMLEYQTDRWWHLPLVVQVTCEPAGCTRMVLYHHLVNLPSGEGTIHISLSKLDGLLDRHGEPLTGVLPLFFEICQAEPPQQQQQHGITPPGPAAPHLHQLPGFPPLPHVGFPSMNEPLGPFESAPGQPSNDPQHQRISDIRAVIVEIV